MRFSCIYRTKGVKHVDLFFRKNGTSGDGKCAAGRAARADRQRRHRGARSTVSPHANRRLRFRPFCFEERTRCRRRAARLLCRRVGRRRAVPLATQAHGMADHNRKKPVSRAAARAAQNDGNAGGASVFIRGCRRYIRRGSHRTVGLYAAAVRRRTANRDAARRSRLQASGNCGNSAYAAGHRSLKIQSRHQKTETVFAGRRCHS